MTTFDRFRYAIALLLVIGGPGSVLFWFPVHPFAAFWRRVGAGWGYTAAILAYAAAAAVVTAYRHTLLSIDFGTSAVTIALGGILFAAQLWVQRRWRRSLTVRTLLGMPELAPERHPGALVTDGVYASVRHPRYIQIIVACAAYACLSNYLAAYGAAAFVVVAILTLIPLEERELAARFGAEYEAYRRRVPALIPRIRGSSDRRGEPRQRS